MYETFILHTPIPTTVTVIIVRFDQHCLIHQIYHLAREKLTERLSWPGISFVVDTLPDFSVCIARSCYGDDTVREVNHF